MKPSLTNKIFASWERLRDGFSQREHCSAYLLSFFYAAYFLYVIVLLHIHGGVSEKEESLIFIQGWLVIPILTVVSVIFFEYLRQRYFVRELLFYPFLLLLNAFFWLVFLSVVHMPDIIEADIPPEVKNTSFLICAAIVFPVLNGIFFYVIGILKHLPQVERFNSNVSRAILFCVPFIIASTVLLSFSGSGMTKATAGLLMGAGAVSLMAFFHKKLISYCPPPVVSALMDMFVVILIVFLVFNPDFHYESHHHNFFLGSVSDLIAGKSLLVDVNGQYGVLIIYFIKWFFSALHMPLSYQGLAFLVTLLIIGLYTLVYFMLRYLVGSVVFSLVAVLLIIALNFFAQIGYLTAYPSTGPLRFGMPYLLLVLMALKDRTPRFKNPISYAEYFLIAVASGWGIDAFASLVVIYVAVILFEHLTVSFELKKFASDMARRAFGIGLFMLVLHAWLAVDIFLRSGQWPHWNYYFEYVAEYTAKGHAFLLIPPHTPWIVLIGLSFVSFMAFIYLWLFERQRLRTKELKIIFGFTIFSILHFTYFLGRSHPNNLLHICIAPIILGAFWLVKISHEKEFWPKGLYPSFIYCCYFALAVLLMSQIPKATLEVKKNIRPLKVYAAKIHNLFLDPQPSNHKVADMLYLVKKYAPDKKRVALFFDGATEVYMLSKRANVFPYNYIQEVNVSPKACVRVLNFAHGLATGDVIFLDGKNQRFFTLERLLLRKLTGEFTFFVIETTENGMCAVRLKRKS